ncbi:MAG: hypothetical protein AABX00_02155 [Nanoarchaeota archaeon]
MKLKWSFKNLEFFESLRIAKANIGKSGLMLLFDVSFFASFYYIIPLLFEYIASKITPSQTQTFLFLVLLMSVGYLLLMTLVYSFFKYSLLEIVKSLFQKKSFSFARLWNFCLMNIIIILPTFLIFNAVLGGVKEAYRPYAFVLLGIPVSLLLYAAINISHSLFYEGASLKKSLKAGFNVTFSKIHIYKEQIGAFALAGISLWALFLIFGFALRSFTSQNYTLYLSAYSYLTNAEYIISYLVFYFVIFVNRISFYRILREMK